jgi:hypothetical protein
MTIFKKIKASALRIVMVSSLIVLCFYSSFENSRQKYEYNLYSKATISDSISHVEFRSAKKSRNSAVRIVSMSVDGSGVSSMSGTYIEFLNRYYVLTVMHGLLGSCDLTKILVDEIYYNCVEYVSGDTFNDYMIMEVERIYPREPISLLGDIQIMSYELSPPELLDKIYYTGYPNTMGPFTVPGTVVGYDPPGGKNFYALSYAWMGASGSGVFGKDGKLIGYVIAIDVGASEFGVQILENVVMIGSVHEVDWNPVLKNVYK